MEKPIPKRMTVALDPTVAFMAGAMFGAALSLGLLLAILRLIGGGDEGGGGTE